MKKIFLLLFLFVLASLLISCASVKFDPESGTISYFRMGDQQIQGFEINKEQEKLKIKMDKQQSKAEALNNIVNLLELLATP